MGDVTVALSVSADGFVAGANDGPDDPLADGGERLFAWMSAGPPANKVGEFFTPPVASRVIIDEWLTEGLERSIDLAQEAVGDRKVSLCAANVAQQALRSGRLDEIDLQVVPCLLGAGVRLFDDRGDPPVDLVQTRVIESDGVIHVRYRVVHRGR